MPIYEFAQTGIQRLDETTFSAAGFHERRDLQRLLRENIGVVAPETLVIAEEFEEWQESRKRIDLLAIDKNANLVVIELKRNEDGAHMDLQAVRYAALVSTMTFDKAADTFGEYLEKIGKEHQDAGSIILDFLGWDESTDGEFAQTVRIVFASGEFSKELTSSVLWLNDYGIDVRCVRLKPYKYANKVIVDVQQIIPPPEAAEYQIQIREKSRQERQARVSNAEFVRFDVQFDDLVEKGMWKRNAIFFICSNLCKNGVNPDELYEVFDWRTNNRIWYVVDGTVNESEFKRLAAEKASAGGPSFNPGRWFCDDSEIVHANNKTYAFSNQWGGPNWYRAMNALKEQFSRHKIEFRPIEQRL